jgi:hypothetical protein
MVLTCPSRRTKYARHLDWKLKLLACRACSKRMLPTRNILACRPFCDHRQVAVDDAWHAGHGVVPGVVESRCDAQQGCQTNDALLIAKRELTVENDGSMRLFGYYKHPALTSDVRAGRWKSTMRNTYLENGSLTVRFSIEIASHSKGLNLLCASLVLYTKCLPENSEEVKT